MAGSITDVKSIFGKAVEIGSVAEREVFLAEACGADRRLRAEVESLLQAGQAAGQFFADLRPPPGATVDQCASERPGDYIGSYKLLEQIGEGGFGVVFVAEQTHPLRRKVALKVLKPGMDSRQVVSRFEAERQALALMDHPNIAKVFDGGATPSGRPYFVMELVKGVPITEYCDQNLQTPRERLELFIPVCQAVQHAHQKGIIHRDLKPSNVLVSRHDGSPVVKVIDFGVAKALGQQLTDKTLYTGFAQLVGTPMYMSPEQAALSGLDVDTRSDIYSLGVLLYELLTGTTPFDKERFKEIGYDEMRRVIREEDPPKPSTRISTLGGAAMTVSAKRKSDPKRLSRSFRGELDWIVMKCLEKDRNRRYETASSLARDIDHYLHDEPVHACPPSAGYRLKKFWRRNRGPVCAAAVVVLCLVGGIAGTTWGLVRAVLAEAAAHAQATAAQEARIAEADQHQLAEREKLRAEENLKQARAAVDKLFTRVAEELAGKPHMEQIRRALLADALEFYKGFLAQKGNDPEMRRETALAYARVGSIQEILGKASEAEAAMRQCVALQEKLTSDFPGVPAYRVDLAMGRGQLAGRLSWAAKNEEYTQLRHRVLADWGKLATDFPTDPVYQRHVAGAHTDLANALNVAMGRTREAEQHYRQALAVLGKIQVNFPNEPQDKALVAHCHLWLGVLLLHGSRLGEAEPELRQALAIYEQRLAQTPDHADAKDKLALVQTYVGYLLRLTNRDAEAASSYQNAVAIREKLRDDFPDNVDYQRRLVLEYEYLGQTLAKLGRTQEAEAALRQSVAVGEKLLADHPNVDPFPTSLARTQFELGLFLHDGNRPEEAADAFRRARQLFEDTVARAPDPRHQNDLAWFLATCPAAQFRDGERAVAAARRSLQSPPSAWYYWRTLGIAQYRAGKWQDAVEALTKAMELGGGGDSRDWFFLAMIRWQQGDRAQARKRYDQAVQWMEKNLPQDALLRRIRAEAEEVLEMKKKEPR
jgi:serine/threonine protein kinase/tetratricopeptide (TPR) repeat protein